MGEVYRAKDSKLGREDGKTPYIGAWGSQAFVHLSRGQTPVKKDSVPVGILG